MAIATSTAQPLRFLQDVTARVLAEWEDADADGKRVLAERLREQHTAAQAALKSELPDARELLTGGAA